MIYKYDRVKAACIRSWSAYIRAQAAYDTAADPGYGSDYERDWDAYDEAMDECDRAESFMAGP